MGEQGERRILHRGKKFDFELLTTPGRDGRLREREVVRHPGAVVVAPILNDGRVALIRNQRPAVGKTLWEAPAGTLEADEPIEQCARRELREETGYEAETMIWLGQFYTTPGMTDELMRAYAATGLRQVGMNLEDDEEIDVRIVSASEAIDMIDRGEMEDAKSMLALLLAQRRGLLPMDSAAGARQEGSAAH